jgi:hypothetical protein
MGEKQRPLLLSGMDQRHFHSAERSLQFTTSGPSQDAAEKAADKAGDAAEKAGNAAAKTAQKSAHDPSFQIV